MSKMWKKLASILFEEEEITIEEDLNEVPEMIEIPKLKPMVEKVVTPIVEETVVERRSMMIDVDHHQERIVEDVVVVKKKPTAPEKYQPADIISPIFGGPTRPSQPIENKVYTEAKTRQPLTEIISPMFGKVEVVEHSEGFDAALLEIDVSEMLTAKPTGDEVQTSLFDYLEGLEEHEE